jgi:hypothetical protein
MLITLPPRGPDPAPSASSPTAPSPEPEAIARALDTPRLTLGEIGKAVGASRFALEKYRNGQRAPPHSDADPAARLS